MILELNIIDSYKINKNLQTMIINLMDMETTTHLKMVMESIMDMSNNPNKTFNMILSLLKMAEWKINTLINYLK